TFASPTDITRVDAGQSNVGVLDISGFDLEASYGTSLGAGQLSLRFLISRQNQYRVQENQFIPEIDYAGQSGGVIAGGYSPAPEWMGNLMMGYSTDRFNATATVRHVGDGIFDVDRIGPEDPGYAPTVMNSITTNRVNAATYLNLALSYTFPFGSNDEEIQIFGLVDNLFDKDPAVAPTGGYPTNAAFFDTFGRRWRAGVRISF